ncbi:hypothetical protein M406DRAFT_334822 [Cryphonectria parasitica EP155]|uniref:Uncharacterized protein n=1 Tax=Cryphonectria parasitica (strain ATCC 38755 / EP155) TaxID=660469 RepID=A0A9P5CHG5_CRYP1|nr:uncharacterized protein M406DRAFT_334822 [Cryphonectria parasitica EP155]KAF3760144.1 hypothetical protein M406DRAFT_334822 [Cryphonectria parasitica EP155]
MSKTRACFELALLSILAFFRCDRNFVLNIALTIIGLWGTGLVHALFIIFYYSGIGSGHVFEGVGQRHVKGMPMTKRISRTLRPLTGNYGPGLTRLMIMAKWRRDMVDELGWTSTPGHSMGLKV